MIKTLRRITLGVVIALAVVCMGIFAVACDKNEDDGEAYVITVVYPDGTAVNGQTQGTSIKPGSNDGEETYVRVQFCDPDNACYALQVLGEDGKCSLSISALDEFSPNAEYFAIHLNGLPEGYTYDDNYKVSKTNKEITITLKSI